MKPEWQWMRYRADRARTTCYLCGGNLIWQNDFTPEEYGYDADYSGEIIFLSCADCGANVKYELVVKDDE